MKIPRVTVAHLTRLVAVLVVGWLTAVGPAAQEPAATVTNEVIVKMVKAGLGESLIISSIRQAEHTQFDTSAEALLTLAGSGVGEAVITAMMEGKSVAPRRPSVREVVIPDGTEITVRLRRTLTSAAATVGEPVPFEVVDDVAVGGVTVIARGAAVRGEITEAQPKRSFGRSGKLNFSIDVVQAVNGENLRLRATRERRGGDSYGKAGVITLLAGPFGALVKGKEVELAVGTEYVIYVDDDRRVDLPGTKDHDAASSLSSWPATAVPTPPSAR